MAFNNRMNCKYCYNNYIYNYAKVGQIPDFEAYNITAKLGMIYNSIIKYSDLLLSSEHKGLLAANPIKSSQTIAKKTYVYKKTLISFALQTWPNNILVSLKFPIT